MWSLWLLALPYERIVSLLVIPELHGWLGWRWRRIFPGVFRSHWVDVGEQFHLLPANGQHINRNFLYSYVNALHWSFENVAEFTSLGTALTDHNCIHNKIKSTLNSGIACYYLVRSLLCAHFICVRMMCDIFRPALLSVALCGFSTFRGEHKLGVL